jgi:2-keto-3-deoxy-L-rhamnonate aldolase RhmA
MPWIDIREGNQLRRRLHEGETVFGCFQRIAAPDVTELCAAAGFDFVVIDLEHALISEARIADLVRTADAVGIPAVVRVPSRDPGPIGRLLEIGAAGIQVPQVSSAGEAEEIVRATRHAPEGRRGLATSRQTGYGARMSLAEYVAASSEWPLVVVQVEDRSGLASVDAIGRVSGVDAVFIGLTDLSQDHGAPGDYSHRALAEAVDRAFKVIRDCGKVAAVPITGAPMGEDFVRRGARYLTTSDTRLLLDASRQLVERLRSEA